MFKWIEKLWFIRIGSKISPEEELYDQLQKNGCVDCGCTEFLEGPTGGLAQNIKCANIDCGSKYNVAPMGWAERI